MQGKVKEVLWSLGESCVCGISDSHYVPWPLSGRELGRKSLISPSTILWSLPLTKPNQKPEFKGPLKRVPYISASWAPSRVEKDGERSGGKLTMSSTQGYVTFIIAGKVIRNKSPLLCSVLSHLHTLPFLLPAQ